LQGISLALVAETFHLYVISTTEKCDSQFDGIIKIYNQFDNTPNRPENFINENFEINENK